MKILTRTKKKKCGGIISFKIYLKMYRIYYKIIHVYLIYILYILRMIYILISYYILYTYTSHEYT